MSKGGYQIIDFKRKNFNSGVGMLIPGIYDLIEGTTKPLLFTGIIANNEEVRDFMISIVGYKSGTAYMFTEVAYIDDVVPISIKIEDTDVVTINY